MLVDLLHDIFYVLLWIIFGVLVVIGAVQFIVILIWPLIRDRRYL